jgi:hypothetical protein
MQVFFSVKVGVSGLTSKALVDKGRNNVVMCTGNTSVTLPAGFLASVTTACDALEAADLQVMFNGGKIAFQQKRTCEKVLRDLLKELAGFVTAQTGGDEAKILSTGFDVRKPGEAVDSVGQPLNLRFLATKAPGVVELRWEPAENAINYVVEFNAEGEGSTKWELSGYTSKGSFKVEGLDPAKYYWFRVQAIGRKGLRSIQSDVLKALAA